MEGNPYRPRATAEVESYRNTPDVPIEKQIGKLTTYANPLDWWKDNSTDFPLLSALARCFFFIQATQAQSERTLSGGGQIFLKTQNELDPNNFDLLVSLKHS